MWVWIWALKIMSLFTQQYLNSHRKIRKFTVFTLFSMTSLQVFQVIITYHYFHFFGSTDSGIYCMMFLEHWMSTRTSLTTIFSHTDIPHIRIKIANDLVFQPKNLGMKHRVVNFNVKVSFTFYLPMVIFYVIILLLFIYLFSYIF